MERERRIAIETLDEFEELLAAKDIKIPSNDRESDGRNEAYLYGTEYYDLEDKITNILKREFENNKVMGMTICKKCGSKVFFVDDTTTYPEIDGELIKQVGDGDLNNRNCVRCNFPEQYKAYMHLEEK